MEHEAKVDVHQAEAGDRHGGTPAARNNRDHDGGGLAGQDQPKLPVLVFGIVEVRRLQRELEALDEFMHQAEIRDPGKQAALPRVSRLLDALASDNHLNLLQPETRQQLTAFLESVEQNAPTINISFASDPSASFISKMVSWLRSNIHPQALLQIGLQPTIVAGCVVRTANQSFDFSLRERFSEQRPLLLKALDAPLAQTPEPKEVATP